MKFIMRNINPDFVKTHGVNVGPVGNGLSPTLTVDI